MVYWSYRNYRSVLSILLVLRSFKGVAYCTGVDPDPKAHKEIHLSVDHLVRTDSAENPSRVRDEIRGVLTHEVVHCYQNDCGGTAPGGLIEGFAGMCTNFSLSPLLCFDPRKLTMNVPMALQIHVFFFTKSTSLPMKYTGTGCSSVS